MRPLKYQLHNNIRDLTCQSQLTVWLNFMTVNHKFIIDNELLRHLEKFIFVILVFEPVTFRCLLKLFLPLWGGRWVEVTLLTYGASTLNEPVPSFTKIVSPSRQVLKQVTLLTYLVNVCFCLVPIKVVSSCSFLEIHNLVMAPCKFSFWPHANNISVQRASCTIHFQAS